MRAILLLALMPIIAACSSPKNTYYTLNAPAIPAVATMNHKTRVMVGPVTLPSSMDGSHIVVKNNDNEVTVYEYQRWAGSLKADIEKVVAANLARDLSTPNVWSYAQSTNSKFDYQVVMDVQSLDSKLGDSVMVDVVWTVKPTTVKAKTNSPEKDGSTKSAKPPAANEVVINGRSLVREPVANDRLESLVAAQSRAFDQVSSEIAKAIRPNS